MKPQLSAHYSSRKPSAIRMAQINFSKRTDNVIAVNTAIGNVSLPMYPAMQERMFSLNNEMSPFKNGVVKYSATVGMDETNQAFLNVISASGFNIDNLYSQITDGGSQAMELIIIGTCGPAGTNEKPLLLLDAAYTNYASMANRLGRKTISVSRHLEENGEFSMPDISEIEAAIEKNNPGALVVIPYDNPTGQYIVGGGKLSAILPVHSFDKMIKAIENKEFDGDVDGIPILKYDAIIAGEVKEPGLGPLHTEFDDNGFAYTTAFISSEIVKWKIGTWEVVDRVQTYYSPGHLSVPGGDTKKPWGKYVISLNKITKDRYLPTGPALCQSAQLFDITGDKMKLLLDFPTIGEPHYAQSIPAELLMKNSKKIYKLEDNENRYAAKGVKETKVERKGNEFHITMGASRSHFTPDNIEGAKVGDKVYFHVTNFEQDWDIPHGFAVMGNRNSELLIMPGQTRTILWEPQKVGVYPFYCTDFCSALHQEMQGYIRVSAQNSNPEIKFTLGE